MAFVCFPKESLASGQGVLSARVVSSGRAHLTYLWVGNRTDVAALEK